MGESAFLRDDEFLLQADADSTAAVSNRAAVLIGAGELMSRIAVGRPPAILDVRWRLDQPDGHPDYLAGHIPGAVYVSLEDELSDHGRSGLGRHPLPTGPAVQAAARRWGIRQNQPVVLYDDWNRAGSARAWWVLTAAPSSAARHSSRTDASAASSMSQSATSHPSRTSTAPR